MPNFIKKQNYQLIQIRLDFVVRNDDVQMILSVFCNKLIIVFKSINVITKSPYSFVLCSLNTKRYRCRFLGFSYSTFWMYFYEGWEDEGAKNETQFSSSLVLFSKIRQPIEDVNLERGAKLSFSGSRTPHMNHSQILFSDRLTGGRKKWTCSGPS